MGWTHVDLEDLARRLDGGCPPISPEEGWRLGRAANRLRYGGELETRLGEKATP